MRVANFRGISVGSRQDAPATGGVAGRRMIEMKPVTCSEGIQSIKPAPCDVAGGEPDPLPNHEKVNVDSGGGGFRLLAVDGVTRECRTGQACPWQTPRQTPSRETSPEELNGERI